MIATASPPDKAAQVREGARQAFLKYGYARASTDLLAKAAGVSKATVYVYYASKEELLADVLRHFFDGVAPSLPSMPLRSVADVRHALVDLATTMLNHMMTADYIALLRVIVSEAPHHPELATLFQSTVPLHAFRAVRNLLEQASDSGLLKTSDFDAAARVFVGSLLTYTILDGLFVVDGPPRLPTPERIAALVEVIVVGVTQLASA